MTTKVNRVAWVLLLAVALAAVAVSGTNLKTVTIFHIWGTGVERAQVTQAIALFEIANPDVLVQEIIVDAAGGYTPKLMQMLSGTEPPDIFLWYPGPQTTALVDEGVLMPLTDIWNQYNLDQYIPEGYKSAVTYKGDQWNLPWGVHANIVIYNKSIFSSLGLSVPTTLTEFESICTQIKAAGYYPLTSGWKELYRAAYPVELLIPSYGGPDFYRQLAAFDISWDNATCREMLTTWKRWVENKWWYPDPRSRSWSEGFGLLKSNLTAMDFIGTYAIPILESSGWVLGKDFGVFMFPQINPEFTPTLTGPFDSWCVSAKAPHPEEAARFIAFLATTEAQTMRAKYHGGLACNRFVTGYDEAMLSIIAALDSGAQFAPGFFEASPPLGLQLINHGAMVDFYDNPDIEEFIRRCLDARDQYLEETSE